MRQVCITLEQDSTIPAQPGLTAIVNRLKQNIRDPHKPAEKPHRKTRFQWPWFTSPKEPQSKFYRPSPTKSQQPADRRALPLPPPKPRSVSVSDQPSAVPEVKRRSRTLTNETPEPHFVTGTSKPLHPSQQSPEPGDEEQVEYYITAACAKPLPPSQQSTQQGDEEQVECYITVPASRASHLLKTKYEVPD